MKKLIALILALIFVLPTYMAEAKTPAIFLYVSENGDDSACGSIDKPLKTLSAALELAKSETVPVVINLRGGVYQMTETIKLTSAHTDIVIRNYNKEKVTFTGSNSIPFSAFKKCTDTAFLDALCEQSARDKIYCANISDLGVTNLSKIAPQGFYLYENGMGYAPTLCYNQKPLTLAQYPNEGYLYTESFIRRTNKPLSGLSILTSIEYTIADKRYENWKSNDIWANGYFAHDWANSIAPAIIGEDGVITGYYNTSYTPQANRRVKYFNLPEELDVPGEYYLNRETGVLYLIPTDEMKAGQNLTYTSYNKIFFQLSSCNNITFSGITFSGTLSNAISASSCDGFVVDNCEFTDIGNTAVYIASSYRSGVKNSYFHDIGSRAIRTNNCGNRTKLISGECFITNCRIERFGTYKRCGAMAIQVYFDVGTVVSHCEISDGPYMAIRYEGNDITIEYNEFYNLCYETSDTGMVYTGRQYDTRGCVLRYNYFHDTEALKGTTGMKTQAVYLDDMSSSTKVYGNIFYKIPAVALMGGGRYNCFENNIMLECELPLHFDARGTWGGSWTSMHNNMISNLKRLPYTTGIWAEKYPELVGILDDEPNLPKHNTLKNNILYKTSGFELDALVTKHGTVANNVEIIGINSFEDYKNKNFTPILKNTEIAKKCPEFQPIPFSEIGTRPYSTYETYEPAPYRRHTAHDSLEISETDNGYTVSNRDTTPFKLAIISPNYIEADGIKLLSSAKLSFATVNQTAEITANKDDIIISLDNAEPIK